MSRKPQPKPPQHEYRIPLTADETPEKWLIYDGRIQRIGAMYSRDFEDMVRSHCSNTTMAEEILSGITAFDDCARWFCLLELLKRHKITLYDSREAAEQMRAPVKAKGKRGKAA